MPQLVKFHACVELVKSQVFFFNNNVIFTLSPTTSVLVYLSAKTVCLTATKAALVFFSLCESMCVFMAKHGPGDCSRNYHMSCEKCEMCEMCLRTELLM